MMPTLLLPAIQSGASTTSKDYAAYEMRQWSKLGNDSAHGAAMKYVQRFDRRNAGELLHYLRRQRGNVGSPVLCVGARLGGEVKAFQALEEVQLSIGVDFNPGERNAHVLYGDAHNLHQFKNGTFGTVFSNVLDHILYISRFASEAHRVLQPRGTLLVHMMHQSAEDDHWAVHDMVKERTAIGQQIEAAGFSPVHTATEKNYRGLKIHKHVYRRIGSPPPTPPTPPPPPLPPAPRLSPGWQLAPAGWSSVPSDAVSPDAAAILDMPPGWRISSDDRVLVPSARRLQSTPKQPASAQPASAQSASAQPASAQPASAPPFTNASALLPRLWGVLGLDPFSGFDPFSTLVESVECTHVARTMHEPCTCHITLTFQAQMQDAAPLRPLYGPSAPSPPLRPLRPLEYPQEGRLTHLRLASRQRRSVRGQRECPRPRPRRTGEAARAGDAGLGSRA